MQTILLPDYEHPELVFLIWPEHLHRKREFLIPLYRKLINSVSRVVTVCIITNIHTDEKIRKEYRNKRNVEVIKDIILPDIWIRDFAPLEVLKNGRNEFLKFRYNPSYETRSASIIAERFGARFFKKFQDDDAEVKHYEFPLDGGQIVSDGVGRIWCGFDGKKVDLSGRIHQHLSTAFPGSQIEMLPGEPGDLTFHLDGTLRFIAPGLPVIAKYQNPSKEQQDYFDLLWDKLSAKFKRIIVLENLKSVDGGIDLPSAHGNYLNFLQIGKVIFLPVYKDPQDYVSIEILDAEGFDVVPVECNLLSQLGGVLNCISWKYCQLKAPISLDEILEFSLRKNYYEVYPDLATRANLALENYHLGKLKYSEYSSEELKSFLFYENRRAHHSGSVEPFFEAYIRELYSEIIKVKSNK